MPSLFLFVTGVLNAFPRWSVARKLRLLLFNPFPSLWSIISVIPVTMLCIPIVFPVLFVSTPRIAYVFLILMACQFH